MFESKEDCARWVGAQGNFHFSTMFQEREKKTNSNNRVIDWQPNELRNHLQHNCGGKEKVLWIKDTHWKEQRWKIHTVHYNYEVFVIETLFPAHLPMLCGCVINDPSNWPCFLLKTLHCVWPNGRAAQKPIPFWVNVNGAAERLMIISYLCGV